jgi:hypothetical protein
MSDKCKTCEGNAWLAGRWGMKPCKVCNPVGDKPDVAWAAWTNSWLKKHQPSQSGWSCPRCSRIYGPSVQICVVCNTAVAAKEAK